MNVLYNRLYIALSKPSHALPPVHNPNSIVLVVLMTVGETRDLHTYVHVCVYRITSQCV